MHKRESEARRLGRETAKTGWNPAAKRNKVHTMGDMNQLHMSMGKGHHYARSFKGHDKHWR